MTNPVTLARAVYLLFGVSALVVGSWAMLSPIGFWHFMGLEAGGDTVIATFYGGVFFAVGVLCLLGLRDPFRYSIVLLFMGIYKSVSFLVLMARAASLLGAPEGLPLGGWSLAFQYLVMAVICSWLYRALGRVEHG